MYYDSTYFLFALISFVLAFVSQIWISTSYSRNSKIYPRTKISGEEAGKKILKGENFPVDIQIQGTPLSDHFDPVRDTVVLSTSARNSSVADIAVTAHEFGHVQQKFSGLLLFKLRNVFVPVVNISAQVGYGLIVIGIIFNILDLANIGLILFSSTALFALITLPIEIDATKRAFKLIEKYELIDKDKLPNAKSVLYAASTTYIAALFTSLLNILYFASRIKSRD